MADITGLIYSYRECVRHLWNTYFLPTAGVSVDWSVQHDFHPVEDMLFELMVLDRIGRKRDPMADEYPFLSVIVEAPRTPIEINAGESTGRWDEPPEYACKGDFSFNLMGLWNWFDGGFRDYGYYLVRISGCVSHPHLVGRRALLPVSEALKVIHEESL
jgi:hypothetical protein